MEAWMAEFERQEAELVQLRERTGRCDPDRRFHITDEVDERMGALVERMTITTAAPATMARGVRV